ncbi:hypothetical protein SAMN02745163_03657 [Clostridium cavendishii DSM 21758]|uniref:Uncharacterized protein n=1 Tax=Clostridium cavendishii DSM 21758 TaxID=1121302 RepID=A0A1M6RS84_9CLOT|nr:hypothetical protein [Clostridium cavendishii]SHK35254.1 hypothetical protein SAMN02745163_03657 [Clostridium cavendishii DSM 21758]
MKITGIIGFILILLADILLFVTSMSLPAGSTTSKILLIFAVASLVVSILYFVSGLKANKLLAIISSAVFILMPIIVFFTIRLNIKDDMNEFGKYFAPDSAMAFLLITMILEIVFGITGVILGTVNKNKKVNLNQ